MRLGLLHNELLAGTLPAEADTGHILPAEVCHIPLPKANERGLLSLCCPDYGHLQRASALERDFGNGQGRHKLVHVLGPHIPGTDMRQQLPTA